MLVKAWLNDFSREYLGRELEGSEWKSWMTALIDAKVEREWAETAATKLREQEIPLSARAIIEEIRLIRPAESMPLASSREAAEADSRKCPHCEGAGMVTVFHPLYLGNAVRMTVTADGRHIQTAARVSAHCVCSLGRWMRSRLDRETARRIVDLVDVLAGRVRWLAYDPTEAP